MSFWEKVGLAGMILNVALISAGISKVFGLLPLCIWGAVFLIAGKATEEGKG